MSTSKKSTTKSAKSPAPATKAAAPARSTRTATLAAPAKRAVKKKTASVAIAPTRIAAATVKPVASRPVLTTIAARIDIGFGNTLHLRGEGAGLSWDRGMALDCIEDNLWRITLPESARGHTFKFLVNDLTWNTGPDYTVPAGGNVTLTPEF